MTSDSLTTSVLLKPTRQTFVVADLKCYLCGTVSGSIEHEQTLAPSTRGVVSPVVLRRPGQPQPTHLRDWRRLRCERCGGPLFLDETDVIVRRTEDYNWIDERPRRGRPPKRLVEERRRQQEQLDPQAA
jgi:hypothetical protein